MKKLSLFLYVQTTPNSCLHFYFENRPKFLKQTAQKKKGIIMHFHISIPPETEYEKHAILQLCQKNTNGPAT